MTILIEAISIVVRCDSLEKLGAEALDHFYSSIPNQTYYSDGSLARVGFMDEQDALGFISFLESLGLVHLRNDESIDFAIVLQDQRDSSRCDWLERFEIDYQGTLLEVAAFVDSEGGVHLGEEPGDFVAPDGWSLDERIVFHASRDDLTYLRSERTDLGGILDHYRSRDGQTVFIGRQKRWFDLPFLCLLRMPLRLSVMTSALGALLGQTFLAARSAWIPGCFLGGLFGLILCSQFAKEFPMTPFWIRRFLGERRI